MVYKLKAAVVKGIMSMTKASYIRTFRAMQLIYNNDLNCDKGLEPLKTRTIPSMLADLSQNQKWWLNRMLAEGPLAFISLITNCWQLAYSQRLLQCKEREEKYGDLLADYGSAKQAWRKKARELKRQEDMSDQWHHRIFETQEGK
jgi:hypothetical protein